MVVYHPIFFPIYSVKQKKQYYASHGSHFKQTDNVYEMPMLYCMRCTSRSARHGHLVHIRQPIGRKCLQIPHRPILTAADNNGSVL